MTDVRHILVLPDRDAAEEVADELVERFGADPDDAEGAQWLLVLEDGDGSYDAEAPGRRPARAGVGPDRAGGVPRAQG